MTKRTFGRAGIDADVAHAELERIRVQRRGLTASAVVEASTPEEAPLHPAFEWDDTKAAEQHRLQQARQIIRAVHVVCADEARSEPVYVHIPTADEKREGRYERVDAVVRAPDLFALALGEANGKLRAAANAVENLKRAAKQSDDPDQLMKIGLAMKALETAQTAISALH